MRSVAVAAALAAVIAAACFDPGGANIVADPACVRGLRWVGKHAPSETEPAKRIDGRHVRSPVMHPGGDCIGCHAKNRGPRFLVAGTIYDKLDEPADCLGRPNVEVRLTDANGEVHTTRTNSAGNFYLFPRDAPDFAFPFKARIYWGDGKVSSMFPTQDMGSCNGCHTQTGENDAPGRICTDPDNPICNQGGTAK